MKRDALELGRVLLPDGLTPATPQRFALPLDIVTEAIAILAKRGAGKTYCSAVLVEQIVKAGQPVAVIDPTGAWWGLRSSADGAGDGLPFVIFGGDHGDVPLEKNAGKLVADLLVDERVLAVIDLSAMSKSAARVFMADFLEQLYHRNRDPLHLVIDEADRLAPQRTSAEGARVLGAMEDIVRRGRIKGLGVTLITQRPAVLNKDVLTQVEILVCLRMTGTRDVEAIDDWVRLHADDEQAHAIKRSLPSLPVGTGWFWSPGMDLRARVAIGRRTTFDSSKTPKVGERRIIPKRFAPVDLAKLGEQMAAMSERAAADDPKALRRRIAELEAGHAADLAHLHREIERARAEAAATVPERVTAALTAAGSILQDAAGKISAAMTELGYAIDIDTARAAVAEAVKPVVAAANKPVVRPTPVSAPPEAPGPARTPPAGLSKAQRSVLVSLYQLRDVGSNRARMRLLTGYSPKGSHYRNTVGSLRTAGYVTGNGDDLAITAAGTEALRDSAAGMPDPLPGGAELLAWWQGQLTLAERAILGRILTAHPQPVTAEQVGAEVGYSPQGSHFRNTLGHLRTLNLVEGDRRALTLHPDFATLIGEKAA